MRHAISEAQEDYLEAIYEIIEEKGGVRVKDIAGRLEVKNSSVTVALRHLRDAGLINYEPYGVISLTHAGEDAARKLSETHEVFRFFFCEILGVCSEAANETACRVEHTMHPEVMARMLEFIKFMSQAENRGSHWKELFQDFLKDNEVSEGNLAAPAEYLESRTAESAAS